LLKGQQFGKDKLLQRHCKTDPPISLKRGIMMMIMMSLYNFIFDDMMGVIMATITASSYCFDIHLSSHKWEEYEEQG
jgi:hypothetical protein